RCGLYQGALLVEKGGEGKSLKGLKKALFGLFARRVFEMDILRCDDDHLDIDFHYCPLVKAWQKQGCTDEEIAELCDHAMCGDRGIAESFGADLSLPQTIAKGADTCQIRFHR
ncbi:MAG: L-2-amino-thiazoline-4-carboxylic acid hydrolase, partial [Eggerthellaceae bacterium]|nr:L-2-amino-thiazoline-4-carboxylic acid hydrolase [Eggerthellaceae bacterium]